MNTYLGYLNTKCSKRAISTLAITSMHMPSIKMTKEAMPVEQKDLMDLLFVCFNKMQKVSKGFSTLLVFL